MATKVSTVGGDELGSRLLGVVARLHRWATRHADLPVSPALARLLAQIDELQPVRIGDLARADHCSQPTMSTQVQRLEGHGLATRVSDPTDARAMLISVTPEGTALLHTMRRARGAAVAPLLRSLDGDERRTLEAAVEMLARLMDGEGAGPPSQAGAGSGAAW